MPNSSQSSSDQRRTTMSKSMVREALVASVANTPPVRPPVRFHSTHESTVPRARSPVGGTPPSPSSQCILVAEKYGSRTSPVRSRTKGR